MRTTIDIPASLRQKLVNEAMRKNLKGYSGIIVEALEQYFRETSSEGGIERLKKLRGSLSEPEYNQALENWQEGRKKWRT